MSLNGFKTKGSHDRGSRESRTYPPKPPFSGGGNTSNQVKKYPNEMYESALQNS